ncbi:transposase [Peribacillus sp. NJ11]|uniref:transposase n=1 Tax=Peribacillus sp. NJ11 TaxID=3055861 RepID=UPI0025A1C343|nr:transposase [Peribacillus sp. NJ11]MDM5220335.1 transposase [Peribacillus sp. NJ11]
MMTYKKYDEQFKKRIVKLHIEGKSVPDLGAEYGISPTSIYTWVKTYSNIETTISPKKLNEISKENIRLKKEVEILKQAMSIMSSK